MAREVWLLSMCWGEEKLSIRERGEIGERGLRGENMIEEVEDSHKGGFGLDAC